MSSILTLSHRPSLFPSKFMEKKHGDSEIEKHASQREVSFLSVFLLKKSKDRLMFSFVHIPLGVSKFSEV